MSKTTLHMLDPEVRPALEAFPKIDLNKETIPLLRQAMSGTYELADVGEANIERKEIYIENPNPNQPAVRCLLYKPERGSAKKGGYLHIHGGGYVVGAPEMSDAHNVHLCATLGIVILSVDYRLAPEFAAPSGLDDCLLCLNWLHQNSKTLGVDPTRIAIGGESAGGGLAAAVTQANQTSTQLPICLQVLTYPMLDNLTGSSQAPGDPITGEFVWTRENNQAGWRLYLGSELAKAPYVPALQNDFSGLPPAWIGTAALDLFRDENIEYARRLTTAGVATELVMYPSVCHGFQAASQARVTARYLQDHAGALQRALTA